MSHNGSPPRASEVPLVDELFDEVNSPTPEVTQEDPQVNFILDHTAFTKGIGNIKRWFNPEYVKTECSRQKPRLNLFIPTYTLHEFDYVKRGLTMTASNAREAIDFIEKLSEGVENPPLNYDIQLEDNAHSSLSWDACQKYQVHQPVIGEFPNYQTQFRSSRFGRSRPDHDSISYENSESYQSAAAHTSEPAQMPPRLRYIIRPCIKIMFQSPQQKGKWTLVTEDAITKIWASSFGIECMNITEAELLLFKEYDVNNLRQYDPNRTILDPSGPNSILQETVDTSSYPYQPTETSRPKKAAKSHKNRPQRGNAKVTGVVRNERGIQKEQFDKINHAPRGSGSLWTPGSSRQK